MAAPSHIGGVLKLTIRRDIMDAVEGDMRRQVSEVSANEPGTILYGFHRVGLETADSEFVDYLHVMAYADAAAQEAHWKAEEIWWWDKLSAYVGERQILAERFDVANLVDQFSDGSQGASEAALSVALITQADGEPTLTSVAADLQSPFGWIARRSTDENGLFGALESNQFVVVTSGSTGDSDEILRSAVLLPVEARVDQISSKAMVPITAVVRSSRARAYRGYGGNSHG